MLKGNIWNNQIYSNEILVYFKITITLTFAKPSSKVIPSKQRQRGQGRKFRGRVLA
jgi:hypothetical protein